MSYYHQQPQYYDPRESIISRIQNHASYVLQRQYHAYINPMKLIESLPASLRIQRKHIQTLKNGQWEIYNQRIQCYVGLQVHAHTDGTEQLLRDFLVYHTEMRRDQMYLDFVKQNGYEPEDVYELMEWKPNLTESEAEKVLYPDANSLANLAQCKVCRKPAVTYPPANRHICKVRAVFECYQHRKVNSFSVGICLLDPVTRYPYTRYACAKCGYFAEFVRFDLRENNKNLNVEKAHRKDLCEACGIWGDCRVPCLQPCVVAEVLKAYRIKCRWTVNRSGDGLHCAFKYDGDSHRFDIVPYAQCTYVDFGLFASPSRGRGMAANTSGRARKGNTKRKQTNGQGQGRNQKKKGTGGQRRNMNEQKKVRNRQQDRPGKVRKTQRKQ